MAKAKSELAKARQQIEDSKQMAPVLSKAVTVDLSGKVLRAFWALPTEKGIESGEYTFSGNRTGHYPKGKIEGKELFKPSQNWIAFRSEDRDETYGFTFSDGYEFSIESGSTTDFELKIPQGKSEISSKTPLFRQAQHEPRRPHP